jgi:hypothetical protein
MDAVGDDHGQNPIAKKAKKAAKTVGIFVSIIGGLALTQIYQTSTRYR